MNNTRENRVLKLLAKKCKGQLKEIPGSPKAIEGTTIRAKGIGIYKAENGDAKPKHRYYLYIDIIRQSKPKTPKDDEILTVIMLNPSEKNNKPGSKLFVDGTVTNVIRIAECAKAKDMRSRFSAVEVLNLFSEIDPKPANVGVDDNKDNEDFLKAFLCEFKNPIMLAWGKDGEKLAGKIKKLLEASTRPTYVFRFNGDDSPTHPSPRCRSHVNEFLASPILEEYPK